MARFLGFGFGFAVDLVALCCVWFVIVWLAVRDLCLRGVEMELLCFGFEPFDERDCLVADDLVDASSLPDSVLRGPGEEHSIR